MAFFILLPFLLCLANGLVCSKDEIYYGWGSLLFCVNTGTGATRISCDLARHQIPIPGYEGDLHIINDQVYFPGFIDLLNQSVVNLNPATEEWKKTGPGPTPPNVALDWDDLLIDYKRNLFYGTINWPIDSMDTKRIFVFQNVSNAPAVSILNVSLTFCNPNCELYSYSQMSTLDVGNNTMYLVEQQIGGQTWIMTVDLNKNVLAYVSTPNRILFGIQTIEYNPNDGLIYGFLSLHNNTFLFNTSIITVDPITAEYKTIVYLDVPANVSVPFPDTVIPYLVNLNVQTQQAYAYYGAKGTQPNCFYWELITFSMVTGKVESIFPVSQENCGGELPAAAWGLSSMEYF